MMFNREFYKKRKRKKDMHDNRYKVWKHCPKKREYANSYILNVNECFKEISSKIINIQLWIVIQILKRKIYLSSNLVVCMQDY